MRYNPKKHRLPPFAESGVLLVDKPAEWTSFDVVNCVRGRFNIPKVGHCGTLDPAATGLLVLVLGRFTKLSARFSGEDKTYEGTILLGTQTDSQDMDGEITSEADYSAVTEEQFREVVAGFAGEQLQTPPMVSAKKQDGKRLYELARKGIEVKREPVPVTIELIEVTRFAPPYADFTVKCSKGTYIRTLCADIGEKLGCGACLHSLRRTVSGAFEVGDAVDIDTIKSWEQPELQDYVKSFLIDKIMKNSTFTDF
jgi:tRNA pseudouridine55 synthase